MPLLYDITTATAAATMVGNELAIAAFVHPQLYKLSDKVHAQIAPRLAAILGKVMPLWYGIALALILGAAWEHRPVTTGPGLLILASGILWAAIIVFTIIMLVPINNRIARMNPDHPHPQWLQDRARWDRLHQIRVALLIIAVLLLLAGLLSTSH